MKIICAGMNYAQHNKELCNTLLNTNGPVIFMKPDSSLLKGHKPFFIPDHLGRIEYETELVVRICKLGKTVPVRFAHRYYDAFTVGIDFTARELQQQLSQNGQPWDMAKGFDGAAYIGEWVAKDKFIDAQRIRFRLDVNGVEAQQGYSGDMLHTVDELISYISNYYTLKTGDLLFTGTPAGAGPVNIDDHLEGYIENRKVLDFNCR
ncbi:MAG: fumarylacetoacetate hydrolase family protein [Prevotellaceae bacterium]|nr:fumarylacetoacetate hydrolase family protein [Prevotellaceae bacterium]